MREEGPMTLDTLARRFGLQRSKEHRALEDALLTSRILGALLRDDGEIGKP
jgi:DNA polymerase III epsilon subunit-like protein